MLLKLCELEIKRCLRQKLMLSSFVLLPICFYFIFIFQLNSEDAHSLKQEVMIRMALFSVLGYIVVTLPQDLIIEKQIGWAKRIVTSSTTYTVYFISKVFKTLFLSSIGCLSIFFAGFVNGVSLTSFQWINIFLILLIGSLVLYSVAFLLSFYKDISRVAPLSNFIYLLLALLGGLWVPIQSLPIPVRWICEYLPILHIQKIVLFYLNMGQILWFSVFKIFVYCIIMLIIIRIIQHKVGAFI